MKYNYPIKYALIPVQNCSATDILGYIVSKCYVVSEEKIYCQNGTFSMKYHVIFPYEFHPRSNIPFYINYKRDVLIRSIPRYEKSDRVSQTFDTMEEALKQLKLENEKLIKAKTSYMSPTRKEETQIEMTSLFQKYMALSKILDEYNNNLVIGQMPIEQSIICTNNKEIKVLNRSLYDYLLTWRNDKFFSIYHVSEEEIEQIQNGHITKEHYEKCLIRNDPKQRIMQIYSSSNTKKGCFYLERGNGLVKYDENMSFLPKNGNEEIIYTTENYEDIIKSYIPDFIDTEVTINGKTFAKVIKLK